MYNVFDRSYMTFRVCHIRLISIVSLGNHEYGTVVILWIKLSFSSFFFEGILEYDVGIKVLFVRVVVIYSLNHYFLSAVITD